MHGLLRSDNDPMAIGQRPRIVSSNHCFTSSGSSLRAMCTGAVWHTYILKTICFRVALAMFLRLSVLRLCRCWGVRWRGFLLDDVSNRAVALEPALVHPSQH